MESEGRFGPGRSPGRRQGSDKTEGRPTTIEGARSRQPPVHLLTAADTNLAAAIMAAVLGPSVTSAGADRSRPAAFGRACEGGANRELI